MLADSPDNAAASGAFNREVQLPSSSRFELLDFIADELPRWRDRPDRPANMSEVALTSQLCAHLNSVARHSSGWDMLQFRVEEIDEQNRNRKIDLVAAPCGVVLNIDGRRHCDFESVLPIECKRLPTPKDANRDEREYVRSDRGSTGGIQRFKAGHHGAAHAVAGMIAYIQEEDATIWLERVNCWVDALATEVATWTSTDRLHLRNLSASSLTVLQSTHSRGKGLADITLLHLWVAMN
jgi:hypothetical protein